MRIERPIDQRLARPNVLAFLDVDVHAARNRIFLHGAAVFALDVNLALALGDFAVFDDAVDFADDRRIARLASFKELDNARQTAGDVLGLGGLARNLGEHVARLHLVAIGDHQVGARRHEVLFLGAAGGIANQNRGLVLFVTRRKRDDELRKAR